MHPVGIRQEIIDRVMARDVVAAEVRARTIESLEPGRQGVWSGLETAADDIVW